MAKSPARYVTAVSANNMARSRDGQFNMLVSYTYRSDDPEPPEEVEGGTPSRSHATSKAPEMKNFSFYTVVDLGPIMYREEPKLGGEL